MSLVHKFKNEVLDEINMVQKSIRHKDETIERLRSEKQPFSVAALIEKNKKERMAQECKLQGLQAQLGEIESGLYEEKMREEIEQNQQQIAAKSLKKKMLKDVKKEVKKVRTPPSRKRIVDEYEMCRGYDYFLKVCSTLPDDKRDKLKRMTDNNGFIFRGTWFMGEQPERRREEHKKWEGIIMHEKRGEQYLVHKYSDVQNQVYTKTTYQKVRQPNGRTDQVFKEQTTHMNPIWFREKSLMDVTAKEVRKHPRRVEEL